MKRINFVIIALSIWLLFIAIQCENDECHKAIAFINKSSKDVYVYSTGYGSGGTDSSFYYEPPLSSIYMIKSNEIKKRAIEKRDCLEGWMQPPKGPFNVFVLDVDVYETVPRDTILKYRMVKTITPTLEEMQNSNWTITYTGE